MRRDMLTEVALGIHIANANKGETQVAGFLGVVARKDAQTAGVNRHGVVQTKLEGKISDGLIFQFGVGLVEPRLIGVAHVVKFEHDLVVTAHKSCVVGGLCQSDWANLLQHLHRVVLGASPQRIIEAAKQFPRFWCPAPPEIVSEFPQTLDFLWYFVI